MTAKKEHPNNLGWDIVAPLAAEKTVAFGDGPLKTHRLYGSDEADLLRNIEEFEARLKAANGEDDG